MLKRLLGALGAVVIAGHAAATEQSSYVMPDAGPMAMSTFVDAYLNPAMRAIASCHWGPSAPTNGPSATAMPYQCWADTTSNPVLIKRFDGSAWSIEGALDTTAHTWTPYRQGVALAPIATSGSASDLSTGTVPASRLPAPTLSALGGVQAIASLAHNWIAYIDLSGVPHQAQPSFSDLLSSLACSQEPAFTGDVTTSAGSCAHTLANIPSGVPAAGSILFSNSAAPSTPAAGKTSVYVDSTAKRFHDKNDAGAIGTTVVGDAGAAHRFLTAIDPSSGAISKAQPAAADLSDGTSGTGGNVALTTAPAFTNPTANTQAVDDNSTRIATTAYFTGQLSASGDGTPAIDGTAARGTSTHAARADHVHPTDTTRAPAARNVSTACGLAGGGDLSADRTLKQDRAVNAQAGTSYTIASSDCGKLVTFNNASSVAVALPVMIVDFWDSYQNLGAGVVTITPASGTINGQANLTLAQGQGMDCFSDGTNAFCQTGTGSGGGGGGVASFAGRTGAVVPAAADYASFFPGGFINKFRNPKMDIFQRGTSGLATTTAAGGAYTADGWRVQQAGAAFTCAQDGGIGNANNSLKCVGGTSNTGTVFKHRIESFEASALAGATVTLQVKYKQTSGSSVTPKFSSCYASSLDNFATCTSDLAATSIVSCATATFCTEAYTFNVNGAAANGYEIDVDCNTALTAAQACWITAADIRVAPGVATGINPAPPVPEYRSIDTELSWCQRFLPAFPSGAAVNSTVFVGGVSNSTVANMGMIFPRQTRVPPTGITVSSLSHYGILAPGVAVETITGVTFDYANTGSARVDFATSGLTQGWAVLLQQQSAAALMYFTGAEL